MGVLLFAVLFWSVIGGLVGFAIGSGKGRGAAGFWLSFFFGPIGWIIIAVMQATPEAEVERMAAISSMQGKVSFLSGTQSTNTRDCPFCAETIKSAAILCRFCGKDVEPIIQPKRAELIPVSPKESYSSLAEEFPSSLDAVWDEALKYQPWPADVTPLLRVACEMVNRHIPVEQATRSAFLQAKQT